MLLDNRIVQYKLHTVGDFYNSFFWTLVYISENENDSQFAKLITIQVRITYYPMLSSKLKVYIHIICKFTLNFVKFFTFLSYFIEKFA